MVQKSFNVNTVICCKENVDIEEALDEVGHGRYNLYLFVSCCIMNIGATIDLLGFNVIVPAASCDLDLILTQSGLLTSISLAGFSTALLWGYAADTRGRKPIMLISGTFGCIFSAMSSFSTNFYMMLMLKFIACSFSTASITLTFIFLGENTCIAYRTRYLFMLNVANFTSDFICFVLAYLILPLNFNWYVPFLVRYKPWRLLTLVFTIPMAIGTFFMSFIRESPKFLADKGNTDKALEILESLYKINNGIDKIYHIKSLMKTEKDNEIVTFMGSVVKQTVPIFQPPLLWRTLQLFALLIICTTTSSVFYMWFPAMMNSFFTSNNEDSTFCQKIVANITPVKHDDICIENGSINTIYSGMIFTFILIVFNTSAVLFANWRRSVIIGACLISGISCIAVVIVHHDVGSIILFFLIQLTGIAYGSIQSYYVDVYPTSCRCLATGLGTMITRFACLGGVSLMGAAVIRHCQLTFYCWAVYLFCGILLTIFLPENMRTIQHKGIKTEH